MPKETEEPIIACPRCDNLTSMKGHIVKDGVLLQCPFITVDVVIQPAKQDRIV